MPKGKNKIRKLTDSQYDSYINSLKGDNGDDSEKAAPNDGQDK